MAESGFRSGAQSPEYAFRVDKRITCKKFCGKENIYRGVGAFAIRSGGLGARRALCDSGAGSGMDWSGHECVHRGEACGTIDGSIVGDGAEIICKRKLKDSQGLGRMGLDIFGRHIGARRFPALWEVWHSGWAAQNRARIRMADQPAGTLSMSALESPIEIEAGQHKPTFRE